MNRRQRRLNESPIACRGRRAQFSIDFFLVLSIVVAFAVLLYNVAVGEVGRTILVDSAILGQHALDDFSSGIDFVAFSGNQSRLDKEIFVPKDVNCLFFNSSQRRLYCFVSSTYLTGSENRLESRRLLSAPTPSLECVPRPGWNEASFLNNGTHVVVSCRPLA